MFKRRPIRILLGRVNNSRRLGRIVGIRRSLGGLRDRNSRFKCKKQRRYNCDYAYPCHEIASSVTFWPIDFHNLVVSLLRDSHTKKLRAPYGLGFAAGLSLVNLLSRIRPSSKGLGWCDIAIGTPSAPRTSFVSSCVSNSDSDSFSKSAYNSNRSPTTEKPLCPCLVNSCLIRCTCMLPLILTIVGPNSADIMISTLTGASTGGLVGVKIYAPTVLMSRVDPSP